MNKVLFENTHYQVILPDEPRVVDGVPLNYQMFNKATNVVEGYAQVYPQAVGYVKQWSAMMRELDLEEEVKIVSLVTN